MNDHKRTAFYFVIRESDRAVYFVGRGGYIGAPGGKGERGVDVNDLEIAVREFREETGNLPPGIIEELDFVNGAKRTRLVARSKSEIPRFIATGDQHHVCTYFYRIVPDLDCRTLYIGASPEAETGGEEEVRWVDINQEWHNIRYHIQKGIRLIQRDNASALPSRSRPSSRANSYRPPSRVSGSRPRSRGVQELPWLSKQQPRRLNFGEGSVTEQASSSPDQSPEISPPASPQRAPPSPRKIGMPRASSVDLVRLANLARLTGLPFLEGRPFPANYRSAP